ncbi:MAG: 5-(carboxyamino)imidazole ribonucleotide mutase [Thermoanaerobaculia bacterium]
MAKPWVCIVMGSDSDAPVMSRTADVLEELGVPFEMTVTSAHRTPARTEEIIRGAEANGAAVFVAGAGGAAHLPGVVAAFTTRPVIGVPLVSGSLQGLDSLLAIVQMPGGIPVATVAIGPAGAKNAGILAAEMLAISDDTLAKRLTDWRSEMREQVEQKAAKVERKTTGR